MPKDYATKKPKRRNATRFEDVGDPQGSFKIILFSTVFGIVLALVAVYFYQNEEPAESITVETTQPKPKPSAKTRYQAVPAEDVESNEFSYHESLENKTVVVETPELPTLSERSTRRYVMQCGSFRTINAAENLRAQIGMNGFEARIKTSSEKNGTWHRVQIGPYESKRQAERDRHQLERNNVNQCRIW
ncbi:MAG: SPOR domain-containing protein [Gammaproteobacteria bacterium]|nr:SPOR domain-containing protein [Gammaproteobacteria bacterium]NNJ71934.1 hypothetical protein [Enterobacterales bacterium]